MEKGKKPVIDLTPPTATQEKAAIEKDREIYGNKPESSGAGQKKTATSKDETPISPGEPVSPLEKRDSNSKIPETPTLQPDQKSESNPVLPARPVKSRNINRF